MAKKTGTYYIKQAQKNGLVVKNGKGDHCKVYAPNGAMAVIPVNLKGNGTEHSIIKWFLKLGIIVILVYVITCFL